MPTCNFPPGQGAQETLNGEDIINTDELDSGGALYSFFCTPSRLWPSLYSAMHCFGTFCNPACPSAPFTEIAGKLRHETSVHVHMHAWKNMKNKWCEQPCISHALSAVSAWIQSEWPCWRRLVNACGPMSLCHSSWILDWHAIPAHMNRPKWYASASLIHWWTHHICQEYFKGFCEDRDFMAERRKILRKRAGLKDTDRHKVFCRSKCEFELNLIDLWHPLRGNCTLWFDIVQVLWYVFGVVPKVPKFRFLILDGRSFGEAEATGRDIIKIINVDIVDFKIVFYFAGKLVLWRWLCSQVFSNLALMSRHVNLISASKQSKFMQAYLFASLGLSIQAESDFNFNLCLEYTASFAHDLPRRKEVEASDRSAYE